MTALDDFRAAVDGGGPVDHGEGCPRGDDHPHGWRRLNLAEIVGLADLQTPWRCHGVAADGFLTVLSGRGGEGKSMLTLGLAGGVLLGASIAGIDCEAGHVAIFDAENGPKLIGRRLKAAGLPHEGLSIFDADGLDLMSDASWIAAQLTSVNLAIFDSLRALAPGAKENDSDDMAPRMAAMRRLARDTSAAIVLVHHRGRDSDKDYRGSSVILDQTDIMLVLERDPKDSERHWRRYLRCAKCRIDQEPAPRWIGIRHHHGELSFTNAVPFTHGGTAPKRMAVQGQIVDILARDGCLRRADVARKLGRELSDGTFRRAFEQLNGVGQIVAHGELWTVATNPDDKQAVPTP